MLGSVARVCSGKDDESEKTDIPPKDCQSADIVTTGGEG